MIPMLRSLFAHLVWADGELLKAIEARAGAFDDEELKKLLHHIASVERFFFALFVGQQLDADREREMPQSLEGMRRLFDEAHQQELGFVQRLQEADLSRTIEMPRMKEFKPTLRDLLMQVVMHSEHHRAQCAMRLRALGGNPGVTDYIFWVRTQGGTHGG